MATSAQTMTNRAQNLNKLVEWWLGDKAVTVTWTANKRDNGKVAPEYDATNHSLVLFDRGDEISVQAGPEGIRFLLVSGKPIEEPVAWYGPIVMNTQQELQQAFHELQDGSFIRHR